MTLFCCLFPKTLPTLNKLNTDDANKVCLSVCGSLASDSSETTDVIILKLGMVTASDMEMHHMLIILTLAFIQGRMDLNHENNKCSIVLEGK